MVTARQAFKDWSASLDASRERRVRVVYFIASHVHPEQIVRLARACRSGSPDSRVLIHHDYSISNLDRNLVESLGNVHVIPAERAVGWGGFATCALVLRSMRWLLDRHDFDWVCHLSGQDYPIRPVRDIERDLSRSMRDGYLQSSPVEQCTWDVGPARYLYQYFPVPRFPGSEWLRHAVYKHQLRTLERGGLPKLAMAPTEEFRLGVPAFRSPFRGGFDCYKASTWWTLNKRSVQFMIDDAERHPKLLRYYQRVGFAPNESLFATILLNNPELDLVRNDDRRFIRWSQPKSGHPDVLGSADVGAMTASRKDFARKIDSRKDPHILDLLDEHIGVHAPTAVCA